VINFPDSPTNGTIFTSAGTRWQYDGAKWLYSPTQPTTSGIVAISDTPPASPTVGQTWFDSVGGQTYIWFNDGTSTQWVPMANPSAPMPLPVSVVNGGTGAATALAALTNLGAAPSGAINNVGRNLVHNSLFNVQQRGAGPFTTSGAFSADRWQQWIGSGDTINTVINSTGVAAGIGGDEAAQYALYTTFTGASGAANLVIVQQNMEKVQRLAGKTVTVSFWAATNAGSLKIGVSIDQSFGSGGSPSASVSGIGQSITATTTYARYSMTFAVPSVNGKTLGTNGNDMTQMSIWYSAGANYAVRSGNVGIQSGGIAIWGVQLEIGSVTPLEKPDPADDLRRCQRFYCTASAFFGSYQVAGNNVNGAAYFPVTMRSNPTIVITANSSANVTGAPAWSVLSPEAVAMWGGATATGTTTVNVSFTASADL
jgi:hypothetical protein